MRQAAVSFSSPLCEGPGAPPAAAANALAVLGFRLRIYSRSPKVGNPIASILKRKV